MLLLSLAQVSTLSSIVDLSSNDSPQSSSSSLFFFLVANGIQNRFISLINLFFFFFQAEDGIRDHCVTGVQTCALPICFEKRATPALILWPTLRRCPFLKATWPTETSPPSVRSQTVLKRCPSRASSS